MLSCTNASYNSKNIELYGNDNSIMGNEEVSIWIDRNHFCNITTAEE